MISINVPMPPSANAMFLRSMTRRGKRNLTPGYKKWRDEAGWLAKMQIVGIPQIDCRFDVRIEVPVSRADTDNRIKPLLDLCQNIGLISNDGNQRNVAISPVPGRTDCLVVLIPLPDEGGVRKPARMAFRTSRVVQRPTVAQVRRAERARVLP